VYLAPRQSIRLLLLPSYIWAVLISLFAILLLYVFQIVSSAYILHIGILAAISACVSAHTSLLIGKEKIREANLLLLLQSAATILTLLIMFAGLEELTIHSYFLALYVAYGASLLLSALFIAPLARASVPYSRREQTEVLKVIFRYGLMNQSAHILHLFSFRISYYIIETISGSKVLGIYSNAVSIIESVWLVSGSIALVLYSRISNITDNRESATLTSEFSKLGILVSLMLIIPLLLLPSSFYVMLFGSEFTGINILIMLLAPGVLIYNYAVIIVTYFSGTGRFHINLIASAVGLVFTIVFSLILIPLYSGAGAAIAASISYGAASLFLMAMFLKYGKTGPGSLIPSLSFAAQLWSKLQQLLKERGKSG
jgi:O-antigen/teichoic acid export membrane protein